MSASLFLVEDLAQMADLTLVRLSSDLSWLQTRAVHDPSSMAVISCLKNAEQACIDWQASIHRCEAYSAETVDDILEEQRNSIRHSIASARNVIQRAQELKDFCAARSSSLGVLLGEHSLHEYMKEQAAAATAAFRDLVRSGTDRVDTYGTDSKQLRANILRCLAAYNKKFQVWKAAAGDTMATALGQALTADVSGFVKELDFCTSEHGAVFWTGYDMENQRTAVAYAASTGKMTIEMTCGGRILDQLGMFSEASPIAVSGKDCSGKIKYMSQLGDAVFDCASKIFAQSARGTVTAVIYKPTTLEEKTAYAKSAYIRVEEPILQIREQQGHIQLNRVEVPVHVTAPALKELLEQINNLKDSEETARIQMLIAVANENEVKDKLRNKQETAKMYRSSAQAYQAQLEARNAGNLILARKHMKRAKLYSAIADDPRDTGRMALGLLALRAFENHVRATGSRNPRLAEDYLKCAGAYELSLHLPEEDRESCDVLVEAYRSAAAEEELQEKSEVARLYRLRAEALQEVALNKNDPAVAKIHGQRAESLGTESSGAICSRRRAETVKNPDIARVCHKCAVAYENHAAALASGHLEDAKLYEMRSRALAGIRCVSAAEAYEKSMTTRNRSNSPEWVAIANQYSKIANAIEALAERITHESQCQVETKLLEADWYAVVAAEDCLNAKYGPSSCAAPKLYASAIESFEKQKDCLRRWMDCERTDPTALTYEKMAEARCRQGLAFSRAGHMKHCRESPANSLRCCNEADAEDEAAKCYENAVKAIAAGNKVVAEFYLDSAKSYEDGAKAATRGSADGCRELALAQRKTAVAYEKAILAKEQGKSPVSEAYSRQAKCYEEQVAAIVNEDSTNAETFRKLAENEDYIAKAFEMVTAATSKGFFLVADAHQRIANNLKRRAEALSVREQSSVDKWQAVANVELKVAKAYEMAASTKVSDAINDYFQQGHAHAVQANALATGDDDKAAVYRKIADVWGSHGAARAREYAASAESKGKSEAAEVYRRSAVHSEEQAAALARGDEPAANICGRIAQLQYIIAEATAHCGQMADPAAAEAYLEAFHYSEQAIALHRDDMTSAAIYEQIFRIQIKVAHAHDNSAAARKAWESDACRREAECLEQQIISLVQGDHAGAQTYEKITVLYGKLATLYKENVYKSVPGAAQLTREIAALLREIH
jgi:hypothetical protein